MSEQTWIFLMCVKQSSSSPGLPVPCLHSRTVALTPSPDFTGEQHTITYWNQMYIPLPLTHTHKHSLWVSCGTPVAAEVGRVSTEWVPQASYRQTGHWPYQSPTHHPPCSSRFPSNHTESYREYTEPRDYLHKCCFYTACVSVYTYRHAYTFLSLRTKCLR